MDAAWRPWTWQWAQEIKHMAHPVTVTDSSFNDEVINSDTPVLVDFWASWCAPCKAIAPVVEDLATEYDGRMKMVKIDIDANPVVPGQFGVMSIPTLMVFLKGKPVERIVGYQGKSKLTAVIDGVLAAR